MSDASSIDVANGLTSQSSDATPAPTLLTQSLLSEQAALPLATAFGRLTTLRFSSLTSELKALRTGCAVSDGGMISRIAIRGDDRLRWLNGMVTNAVQQLAEGQGNYSFLLNAQGRIQGDALVLRENDQLVLETSVDQVAPLMVHLDHFIIMDDVTLADITGDAQAITVTGPHAKDLLSRLAINPLPQTDTVRAARALWQGGEVEIVSRPGPTTAHFELWARPDRLNALWQALLEGGAEPAGLEAMQALRILDAIPQYGADISSRDLPQETSQARALNFNKGCYLGQEIVERVRSRGAVHRSLQKFILSSLPPLPADLTADGQPIGKVTSAITLPGANGPFTLGLGIVRTEAVSRGAAVTYNEGSAVPVDQVPDLHFD